MPEINPTRPSFNPIANHPEPSQPRRDIPSRDADTPLASPRQTQQARQAQIELDNTARGHFDKRLLGQTQAADLTKKEAESQTPLIQSYIGKGLGKNPQSKIPLTLRSAPHYQLSKLLSHVKEDLIAYEKKAKDNHTTALTPKILGLINDRVMAELTRRKTFGAGTHPVRMGNLKATNTNTINDDIGISKKLAEEINKLNSTLKGTTELHPLTEYNNNQEPISNEPELNTVDVVITNENAKKLEITINRWVYSEGLSHQESKQRKVAKDQILAAYKNHSEELVLANLNLSSLPPEIGYLTSLKRLSLDNNNLASLPIQIRQLTSLEHLTIKDNKLQTLPKKLNKIKSLQYIELQGNQLSNFYLDGLPCKKGLLVNLEDTQVSRSLLEQQAQSEARYIDTLMFETGNRKDTKDKKPTETPSNNPVQPRLDNIEQFSAGLDRWVNEENISEYQAQNRRTAKDKIIDAYTHNNNELLLNGLSLSRLPDEICKLEKLETLDLENNWLSELPRDIGHLKALKNLHLRSNKLSSLPPEIGQLKNLDILSIEENQLSKLPREIGQLINLDILALENNQLSELPNEISGLKYMRWLNLEGNQIGSLPPKIGQLRNLEKLILTDNALTDLPAEIGQLRDLEVLDIENNVLFELPNEMGNLTDLHNLILENNSLSNLPPQIGQLTRMTELNLRQNELTSLPIEITQMTDLQELRLDNNQLISFPADIAHMPLLRLATMNHNRLAYVDVDRLSQPRNSALYDADFNHSGLTIELENNLFSSATVAALNNAQNQEVYRGPNMILSIVGFQDTDELSADDIREVLARLEHSDDHPLWDKLEERSAMGDIANDFTLLLAKLYNQAPRENGQLTGRIHEHISRVLTTLEQLHDQGKPEAIEEILNNAHGAVATCVDRAAIHLLLMSAQSHYYQSGDEQALADINIINATIDFVSRVNKNDDRKLLFDNNSGAFRPYIDITNENARNFNIGDEVEDVLQLLNSGLLKSIEGCDMRFGTCVTLKDQQHLNAARAYIWGSLNTH